MAYDVKKRKRQLITERINKNPAAETGRRQVAAFVFTVALLRLAVIIYELIYFPMIGADMGLVSDILLFLGGALVLYMVTDGNRGLCWVTAISAVVWGVYLFTSVYPVIADKTGAVAYMAVFLAVLAVQFILSIIMATLPLYDTYFDGMQKINLTIRAEMISGGKK